MPKFLESLNEDGYLPRMEVQKDIPEKFYSEPKGCLELARAYVPMQKFSKVYPLCEGLIKGTVFPELYKPMINIEKLETA